MCVVARKVKVNITQCQGHIQKFFFLSILNAFAFSVLCGWCTFDGKKYSSFENRLK